MTAKKTGFVIRNKYSSEVEYEYKDHKYFVEYPTGMNYCCTSPKLQHEIEKAKIDKRILEESKSKGKPFDMNEIFDILGWD